jgi:hypothetical protein
MPFAWPYFELQIGFLLKKYRGQRFYREGESFGFEVNTKGANLTTNRN